MFAKLWACLSPLAGRQQVAHQQMCLIALCAKPAALSLTTYDYLACTNRLSPTFPMLICDATAIRTVCHCRNATDLCRMLRQQSIFNIFRAVLQTVEQHGLLGRIFNPWYCVRLRDEWASRSRRYSGEDDARLRLHQRGLGRLNVDTRSGRSWQEQAIAVRAHCATCVACKSSLSTIAPTCKPCLTGLGVISRCCSDLK